MRWKMLNSLLQLISVSLIYDPSLSKIKSTKSLIKYYKNKGYKNIRYISSADDLVCSVCKKMGNKLIKIDEALKIPPVPNKKCKNLKEDRCRCAIVALNEDQ